MNAISGASAVPGTGGNFDPREAAAVVPWRQRAA